MRGNKLKPGRTNQKLHFAGMHLAALRQALAHSEELNPEALALSYRESVIFHLQGARTAFLQELCRFYGLSPTFTSSEAIRRALEEGTGRIAPEITRIQALEGEAGSWLQALDQAWQLCQLPPEVKEPKGGSADEEVMAAGGVMRLVNAERAETPSLVGAEAVAELESWHKRLQQLVRELREGLDEW